MNGTIDSSDNITIRVRTWHLVWSRRDGTPHRRTLTKCGEYGILQTSMYNVSAELIVHATDRVYASVMVPDVLAW